VAWLGASAPSVLDARDLPFGRCVLVPVPGAHALDGAEAALRPEEAAHARGLAPARRATWVAGRLALRAALADLGVDAAPILSTARGAPLLPRGVVGSVSHKSTLAVALAARDDGAALGIDLERERAPRGDIGQHVLTPDERRRLEGLDEAARVRELLAAFSAKEAIYKALDPWVGRYVLFSEAEIARAPGGGLVASLRLRGGEGPFTVELHEEPWPGYVLVAARIRGR
jgi:enterobactin synthetase component D